MLALPSLPNLLCVRAYVFSITALTASSRPGRGESCWPRRSRTEDTSLPCRTEPKLVMAALNEKW